MKKIIPHSKPFLDQKDIEAVTQTIRSGFIAPGPEVKKLEERLANYIGVKGIFATNSGTSALHLALLALGIKKGDKVILPSLVCYCLLDPINYIGARPCLADIDPETCNIDTEEIKKKIDKKVKAIIVPHMHGQPADIDKILSLGIPIIEDCAQSLGANYRQKKVGSYGDISMFSFFATKLITTGMGGAIATNSSKLLKKIQDVGDNYYRKEYQVRYNYRISDLQASLGLSQLKKLDKFIQQRKKIAQKYNQAFKKTNIGILIVGPGQSHVYFRYILRLNQNVNTVIPKIKKYNIICSTLDYPLHRYLKLNPKDFPNTEEAFKKYLSIPIYPSLTPTQIKYIIKVLKELLK